TSALDVLGMLRGHPRSGPSEADLPFRLVGDDALAGVLERARRGLPVDLIAPRASGRTHCLAQAKLVLEREGRRVFLLRAAARPFASVMQLSGTLEDRPAARLAEVAAVVDASLQSALARGEVVLADDADRMDAYSAAALERCRDAGALVRVFEETEAP